MVGLEGGWSVAREAARKALEVNARVDDACSHSHDAGGGVLSRASLRVACLTHWDEVKRKADMVVVIKACVRV